MLLKKSDDGELDFTAIHQLTTATELKFHQKYFVTNTQHCRQIQSVRQNLL